MDERPRKRMRVPVSADYDDDDNQPSLEDLRRENDRILAGRLGAIFDKYSHDFEGVSDVIDLGTNQVIEDNGHVRRMRHEYDAGRFVRQRTVGDGVRSVPPSPRCLQSATPLASRTINYAFASGSLRGANVNRALNFSRHGQALSFEDQRHINVRNHHHGGPRVGQLQQQDHVTTDESNEWEDVEDVVEDSDVDAEDVLSSGKPTPVAPRHRDALSLEKEPQHPGPPLMSPPQDHSPTVWAIAQVVAELLPTLSKDPRIQQQLGVTPPSQRVEPQSAPSMFGQRQSSELTRSVSRSLTSHAPPASRSPVYARRATLDFDTSSRIDRRRTTTNFPDHHPTPLRSIWAPKRKYRRREERLADHEERSAGREERVERADRSVSLRKSRTEEILTFKTNWSREEDRYLLSLAQDPRYQKDNKPSFADIALLMPRRRQELIERRLERLMCEAVLEEAAEFVQMGGKDRQDTVRSRQDSEMLDATEASADDSERLQARKSSRKRKLSDRAALGIPWAEIDLDSDSLFRHPKNEKIMNVEQTMNNAERTMNDVVQTSEESAAQATPLDPTTHLPPGPPMPFEDVSALDGDMDTQSIRSLDLGEQQPSIFATAAPTFAEAAPTAPPIAATRVPRTSDKDSELVALRPAASQRKNAVGEPTTMHSVAPPKEAVASPVGTSFASTPSANTFERLRATFAQKVKSIPESIHMKSSPGGTGPLLLKKDGAHARATSMPAYTPPPRATLVSSKSPLPAPRKSPLPMPGSIHEAKAPRQDFPKPISATPSPHLTPIQSTSSVRAETGTPSSPRRAATVSVAKEVAQGPEQAISKDVTAMPAPLQDLQKPIQTASSPTREARDLTPADPEPVHPVQAPQSSPAKVEKPIKASDPRNPAKPGPKPAGSSPTVPASAGDAGDAGDAPQQSPPTKSPKAPLKSRARLKSRPRGDLGARKPASRKQEPMSKKQPSVQPKASDKRVQHASKRDAATWDDCSEDELA